MAQLEILIYPDPRLRTIAKPLEEFGKKTQKIIDDMIETMYQASGIGLAATQVNIHRQIIVIDISPERNDSHVFINPRLKSTDGETESDEGCLSVPGYYANVKRSEKISLEYEDRKGSTQNGEFDDLMAICLQHEMDHLQGKVFVDYLSKLKQDRVKKKMRKENKARLS